MQKDLVIDNKYLVTGQCSDKGGMGTVVFVEPIDDFYLDRVVLKYCKISDPEILDRFRREVRLLQHFKGDSKVVEVYDTGLDHNPPYFVMKYYEKGDLTQHINLIRSNIDYQEKFFIEMVDCLHTLHQKTVFHRDIKPQNFLVDSDRLVISDLGLGTELGSSTAFTSTSVYGGTEGYIPPEFYHGGFHHIDATSDIFMLGKSIYYLLTGRNVIYLDRTGIEPQLWSIIDRCCRPRKEERYSSTSELKNALVLAFDILQGRTDGTSKAISLLNQIVDSLNEKNSYNKTKVAEFVNYYTSLNEGDLIEITYKIPSIFFRLLTVTDMSAHISEFLRGYEVMVNAAKYNWPYAETIADNMKLIFDSDLATNQDKELALDLAIRAAVTMNRFAAMDTCTAMIASVRDDELGKLVATLILKNHEHFLIHMDTTLCKNRYVISSLAQLKQANGV